MANIPKNFVAVPASADDKSNWEYVSIPEENALGEAHVSISINKDTFEPGKTYLIPPALAFTLKDRLKVYHRSCVRLLQPNRDTKAEDAVSTGNASSIGSRPISANQFDSV